jgi:Asparagine synthase (glutamine-hydrolyzing)
MCGIAGYYGLNADRDLLQRMNDCQVHRGPDGDGLHTDGLCGLAHRRLSIIDVAHGQQPMATADGRYTIAYNGEVYNYLDLRTELEALGHTFTTDSDTEVVLQAFAQWGAEAFDRFNGMFGLAIWDTQEQRLTLARDHFGIKPVYVCRVPAPEGSTAPEALLFASEIKPILGSGLYEKRVNERSVYRYLKFRAHEDGTETFFEGIERLEPGEMLEADADGIRRRPFTRLKQELLELAQLQRPYDEAAAAEYKTRLIESIRLRLQSEVPVGTSLSGGLDSSAVAVIINQLINDGDKTTESVGVAQNTFSAVFPNSINDEEKYVDAVLDICEGHVAAHKILPTADEFKADLEDFIRTQEEPLISSGPYAQFQVMREATKHVTVLLDGQGADEMMAGYIPYYMVYLRQLRKRGNKAMAEELSKSLDVLYRLGRFRLQAKLKGKKDIPVTDLMGRAFVAQHQGERFPIENDHLKKRLVQDLFHNSLPSLLRYEDKNTMRFSLEGRVPIPRQGGDEVRLQPHRRGDHQGRLEQADPARCDPRPAPRGDQPPPQQDRLHHPAERVVHAAEEPLLLDLPQRVLRDPSLCRPARRARGLRGVDQGRERRRLDGLLALPQPRAVAARVLRRQGPRGRSPQDLRQDRLRGQRGQGPRPDDGAG